MNTPQETQFITISREEYDKMNQAVNCLMVLFNTPAIYLETVVASAKKAIAGVADEGGACCDNDTCYCRD